MSDEEEVWKVYPDYDFVEVSNLGRVRTKDRVVIGKDGKEYNIKGRVLKQNLYKNGYMYVSFHVNSKQVNLRVHRIVAITFIPNPNNLPEVNHKDNDRTNNSVDNLEWCTRKYNEAYKKNFGTSQSEVQGFPTIAVNLDTLEVFCFETQHEAAHQLGVDHSSIAKIVRGKRHYKTTGGYWFCNADENAVEKVRSKFGDEIAEKVEKLINENKKF